MNIISIKVDLGSLDALLDRKRDKVEAAARPAAQAGAQVIYDAVKANVAAIGSKSGNLSKSIYQAYSESNSGPGKATYHISWNAKKAPHGHLVEFGHIQRYKVYVGKDGKWYTAVRPNMQGKPKPSRRASQAVKDAYYVPLPTPKQVAARPFIRPAIQKADQSVAAARKVFFDIVGAA